MFVDQIYFWSQSSWTMLNVLHLSLPERWTILAPLTQPFLLSGDSGNWISHLMISLRGFCPGQPIAIWKVENEKLFKPRHLFQSTSCECSYASEAMLAAATLWAAEAKAQRFTSLWPWAQKHWPPNPDFSWCHCDTPRLRDRCRLAFRNERHTLEIAGMWIRN